MRVVHGYFVQGRLARQAPQIRFEQRRPVDRIAGIAKRHKSVIHDQHRQAQQTQLIRRRDHNPSARPREPDEVSDKRPRVLEMLDGLERDHEIGDAGVDRPAGLIQIGLPGKLWENKVISDDREGCPTSLAGSAPPT